MTNIHLPIDEYEDIEVRNAYQELVIKEKSITKEEFLQAVLNKSRDNGRTPMQWDDSPNAGFTTGIPWFKVNPRYEEINVKEALRDADSIFYYYKKLIELRHTEAILTEGNYQLLLPESKEIFAYLRTTEKEQWLVAANLSEKEAETEQLLMYGKERQEIKISNYPRTSISEKLRPYEAFMMRVK